MIDISRRELKYLFWTDEAARIRRRIAAILGNDPHNTPQGYLVRSLYFDSLYDSDFEDKLSGCDCRKKIRLRVYDPSSETVKLELKEKEGNAQRKRSLSLGRAEAQQMILGDFTGLMRRSEPLAHWLYTYMTLHCYRPKCIVEYRRLAYLEQVNDIRITFDSQLRATEAGGDFFASDLMLYPVALDDFGFAYSSLTLLKEFEIDTLKLDRSFFVNENEKSRQIVKSMIELAHNLDMKAVAEGIEDAGQVTALKNMNCDYIQGFIYSQPMTVEAFENWREAYEKEQ